MAPTASTFYVLDLIYIRLLFYNTDINNIHYGPKMSVIMRFQCSLSVCAN